MIKLGDRDDTLVSDNVGDLEVIGGSGDDTMRGGSRPVTDSASRGNRVRSIPPASTSGDRAVTMCLKGFGQPDTIDGGKGNDELVGGKGKDDLYGGGGNDLVNARDGARDRRINCGPGNDRAKVDRVDPDPVSC